MKKIFCVFAFIFFSFQLFSQNDTLGRVNAKGKLRIIIVNGQTWIVEKADSNALGIQWFKQFYTSSTPIFSLKIDTTVFSSGTYGSGSGVILSVQALATVTTGNIQYVTKKYSGTYKSLHPFSVTITISHDVNTSYAIISASIDATKIPKGIFMRLGYGFDSYVNNCDRGYALVVPDANSYNNKSPVDTVYPPKSFIQNLSMIGGVNCSAPGSLIGFFRISRPFDFAHCASHNTDITGGYSHAMARKVNNKLTFGPCSGCTGVDLDIGVAFDSIPSGEVTDIQSGLSFTNELDGEVDYFWNGAKRYVAAANETVNLQLKYKSYSPSIITNAGFRVNFPGLKNLGSCSQVGFSTGTKSCTAGTEFFEYTGGTIGAGSNANINISIKVPQPGRWDINAASFTNLSRTLPLGATATLLVQSPVSFASTSLQTCTGDTATLTVKFPVGITPAQDAVLNLNYTGDTASFGSLPSTITIPANQNSNTIRIATKPGILTSKNLVVSLSVSDTTNSIVSLTTGISSSITVNPLPIVNLTSSASTICSGSSSTLTASGATTYTWAPTTGLTPTTGSSVTARPTTTTTYTVTGTDGKGCVNTKDLTLTVNSLPTVTLTAASSEICSGKSTTLTAGGANTYSWSPVTGLSATTGSPVTANPTATTTYTVTGTDAKGCVNTKTLSLTVNPLPTVTLTAASSEICSGSSTTLTAGGANTYNWSPATGLSATTGSLVTANPTTNTTYIVTGTNNKNCVNTKSITLTVNSLPTVTLTAASSEICSGKSTTLTAGGASTYTWSPVTGLSATTGSLVTANPTTTTTYTVTGTDSKNCVNTKSLTLTVNPLPTVTLTAASSEICSGKSTTLTAGGASTYSWSPVTGLSATTGSPVTANPTTNTTYTVTGTDGKNCVNTKSINLVVKENPIPIINGSTNICATTDATNYTTESGMSNYLWSVTGGSLVSGQGSNQVSVAWNIEGSQTLSMSYSHPNGCSNSTTKTVQVSTTPVYVLNEGWTIRTNYEHASTLRFCITNKGIKKTTEPLHVSLYKGLRVADSLLLKQSFAQSPEANETLCYSLDVAPYRLDTTQILILAVNDTGKAVFISLSCDNSKSLSSTDRLQSYTNQAVCFVDCTTNVKALNNDKQGNCEGAKFSEIGLIPNSGLQNGSLTINADSSFQYVPNTGVKGVDSVSYYIRCDADSAITQIYFLITQALEAQECPLNSQIVGFESIPNVTYNWYDQKKGGVLLSGGSSTDTLTIQMGGANDIGTLWIEPVYRNRIHFPRIRLQLQWD